MLNRLLNISFYLLFFLTPLVFSPLNYELFEFNKMLLVYFLTVIITGLWIIRIITEKRLIWRSTPLDIPLILFLISQILSTFFSIDPHTSVWGYYSRSHGGLLSTISYLLLYWAMVSNYPPEGGSNPQMIKFLKAGLLSGIIISVWGILEHFGHSPSCYLLTGVFNDTCWVQDVQARVFATLGQPNWMAAYLEMLIFPLFFFLFISKKLKSTITSITLLVLFYTSFTFTFSRGAALGLLGGFAVLAASLFWLVRSNKKSLDENWKFGLEVLGLFLIVNLVFGSALTRFKLLNFQTVAPPSAQTATVSQLEQGGTESSQIRLIVWRGALDIYKHYPLFGSGVETFAYSYYNFRPVEQNLVSEWDFLYNKAHNEYLNFLSTTGLVGFLSYMLIIIVFIGWTIRYLLSKTPKDPSSFNHYLLTATILSSFTAYLIQDFFQFSVVIIALFFFLFPALLFSQFESLDLWPFHRISLPFKLLNLTQGWVNSVNTTNASRRIVVTVVVLILIVGDFNVYKLWLSDTHYSKGTKYLELGDPGKAYNELVDAVSINPWEPLYKSQLGFAASYASIALADKDATLSATLKNRAETSTDQAVKISPKNLSVWRTAFHTYYQLSSLDPNDSLRAENSLNTLISLAPTDPEFLYEKGLYLDEIKRTKEAAESLKRATELKPNYRDAHFALGSVYQELGQKDQAVAEMENVLKIIPNDPDALDKLKTLKVQ